MPTTAVHLRLGRPEDARAISLLARRVARRWILPEQSHEAGQALLLRLGTRALRERMREGQRFHLAWLGEVLVGIAAMRGDSHLVHFFVGTRYQGRGIARRLWERAMADAVRRAGTGRFTLNATRCAVPVYRRFGFVPTGPEGFSPSGVLTTPMALETVPARRAKA
ncbi:MAG: GNAT family N-acetyltransferase [Frateuria sp.]|uniref:GNAT family N-acetyltransferase n=1 Tax=Frateuria sp. TaxID=2211372 RepID=UPI00179BFFEC|nr:GNAT family N-acetyltransferase [Frateuria sp.]NUO72500.1 GNAT family N-acetyltransferase [Frateuria sp.]NUR23949.1 GNAT family N-acetyltransferase [Frateuria sp.]